VISDRWDISHIAISVDDLEEAMAHYGRTLGVEWGPIAELTGLDVVSLVYEEPISMEGLREVWSVTGPPIELSHSAKGSPSQQIWGVPDGVHRVHHICYWVDDLQAESDRLIEHGYGLEVTVGPGPSPRGMTYHLPSNGMRLSLMRAEDKPALQDWLKTGKLELQW
jgi:catechol 2,3-dioxygenase-like lactoylglutathione lyase family enzyme